MDKTNLDQLAEQVIGRAIEIHRTLGPGLLESVYEEALGIELEDSRVPFERQKMLPVVYKGRMIGEFRADLVVASALLVEVKSVERHAPVFEAQVLLPQGLGAPFRAAAELQFPAAQGRHQADDPLIAAAE